MYVPGISSDTTTPQAGQGAKYWEAVIPPPGVLFACLSLKASRQNPGFGAEAEAPAEALAGSDGVYGGGGGSFVRGTEGGRTGGEAGEDGTYADGDEGGRRAAERG